MEPGEDRLVASVRGSLLGCAVGDAIGAPYEGLWGETLPSAEALLEGYGTFHGFPPGQYTDDTQLSLATVEATLETGEVHPQPIAAAFAELFRHATVIGPGGACMQAADAFMASGDWRGSGAPEGQAGNGTAMRAAVVGMAFVGSGTTPTEIYADVARVTHQDARSVAGGVAISLAAQRLAEAPETTPEALCDELAGATRTLAKPFSDEIAQIPKLLTWDRDRAARHIAPAGQRYREFDEPIITPFVVPTVLASLWAALRHPTSWGAPVAEVIRLGGDVDTTGAIVGALQGARLGVDAIPAHLRDGVVDAKRIDALAKRYTAWIRRR